MSKRSIVKKHKKRKKRRRRPPPVQGEPLEQRGLEQHLRAAGLLRSDWNVHEARCENDPMYHLLFFPDKRLQMSDNSNPCYVDHLLKSAIDILRKRYGQTFEQSRWIAHVLPMLLDTTITDVVPKIFAICFMLKKEPTLASAIADLYDDADEQGTDMFAKGGSNHFYAFLRYMRFCIEQHLNNANNKYTVAQELRGFVQHMRVQYMIGPPQNTQKQ